MFDKFGEFDSAEELNVAAEGFLNEGDLESLYALAEENGIDRMDAEDYAEKLTDHLTTVADAAIGRLTVQEKELKGMKPMEAMPILVILNQTRALCTDPKLASAVMRREKRIHKIYDAMKEEARKAGIVCCCGTDRDLEKLIHSYFTEDNAVFLRNIRNAVRRQA